MDQDENNGLPTFSFPARVNGNDEVITVVTKADDYEVFISGKPVAKLKLSASDHSWFITGGNLPEPELEAQIGERIEAQYF